ncbi:hypothetical protein JW905_02750 [bacterium]|nr:hypothetical protein [candidate division CSSED10-310 bacterium]
MKERLFNVLPAILAACCALSGVAAADPYTPNWIWEDEEADEVFMSYRPLAITPDGAFCAAVTRKSGNDTSALAVFETTSPWPILRREYSGQDARCVALSDNGQRIACSVGMTVYVYELPDTLILEHTDSSGWMKSVALSADGSRLAFSNYLPNGTYRGKIYFYDLDTGSFLWSDCPGEDVGVAARLHETLMSEDGLHVIGMFGGGLMGDPGYVVCYDTDSPTPSVPAWITQPLSPCWTIDGAYSRDGSYFTFSTWCSNQLFDLSPPVAGEKEPIWTESGGGQATYSHYSDLSRGAGVVCRFSDAWMDSGVMGLVKVCDGSDGSTIWSQEYPWGPVGAVSGDGSRVVFSPSDLEEGEEGYHYVYDLDVGEIIWTAPCIGHVVIDEAGDTILLGGGAYHPNYTSDPLRLIRPEPNEPPVCAITAPTAGGTVAGTVLVTGTAGDSDDTIRNVEVITPWGVQCAASSTGFAEWELLVDLVGAPTGEFTIRARAVDHRYKYGVWHDVTVTIAEATATPTPTVPLPTVTCTPLVPSPTEPPVSPTTVVTVTPGTTPAAPDTPTPPPTAMPTTPPTPTAIQTLAVHLLLPAARFRAGDTFFLDLITVNPEPAMADVPMVIMLEVHGVYFMWPSWRTIDAGFDYAMRTLPTGLFSHEIITPLIWPENVGTQAGLLFYGALLSSDMTELRCPLDVILWGYE